MLSVWQHPIRITAKHGRVNWLRLANLSLGQSKCKKKLAYKLWKGLWGYWSCATIIINKFQLNAIVRFVWFNIVSYYFLVWINTTDWWYIKDWSAGWEVLNGTRRESTVLLLIVRNFTKTRHLPRLSHQNSDRKRDGYISHDQYFETGIVPKRDPYHSKYMCREHTCCSVYIHVLNGITNCFVLKAQVGAN